jgi:hypothetical protein
VGARKLKELPFAIDVAYYEPPPNHERLETDTARVYSTWSEAVRPRSTLPMRNSWWSNQSW